MHPNRLSFNLGHALFESAVDGIIVIDCQGRIRAFNHAAEKLFGFEEKDVLGRNVALLMGGEDAARHDQYISNYLTSGHKKIIGIGREVQGQHKDGRRFPMHLSVGEFESEGERYFVAICHDTTAYQRALQEKLEAEALYRQSTSRDAMTGLANRSQILERIKQAIQGWQGGNHKIAVIYLDIDRFRGVNDLKGLDSADRLLQAIGWRLAGLSRPGDIAARWGSDEFVILADHLPDAATSFAVAEQYRTAVAPVAGDQHMPVTASAGVSLYPDDSQDPAELVRLASLAMYEAKKEGGNCLRFYTEDMNRQAQQFHGLGADLVEAIRENSLEVHYQPKVSLRTNQVVGVEALLRWNHPRQGWISPAVFVPIAEELGLGAKLDRWVLSRVSAQLASWLQEGGPVPRVAVNLSAKHFRNPVLARELIAELRQKQVPAELIELEITETALLQIDEATLTNLTTLRNAGIHIAVDDFGTGYSSLKYLCELPLTTLKIDRSFVQGMTEGSRRQQAAKVVRGIIDLAQALQLETIAEGIETQEQLEMLRAMGCDQVQGFLLARPMPADQVKAFIERTSDPDAMVANDG